MDIPGTSGPLHTAASSLHRSKNLDLKQKLLFLLINNCSGAQKYPKCKGSEMVPFSWRSVWFPKSNHKLLTSVSCTSQLIIFPKALQFASVQPVKGCTMNKHAQDMLKDTLHCSWLFLQESHHPTGGAGFDVLALNREFFFLWTCPVCSVQNIMDLPCLHKSYFCLHAVLPFFPPSCTASVVEIRR